MYLKNSRLRELNFVIFLRRLYLIELDLKKIQAEGKNILQKKISGNLYWKLSEVLNWKNKSCN